MKRIYRTVLLFCTVAAGAVCGSRPGVQIPGQLIFSEIAWAGGPGGYSREWMELYNPGSRPVRLDGWYIRGTLRIALKGTIPARGWFLLERSSDEAVPGIPADQIYRGVLPNRGGRLELVRSDGSVVDRILMENGWEAGSVAGRRTMQRCYSHGWRWRTGPAGYLDARNSGRTVQGAAVHRATGTNPGRNSAGKRNKIRIATFNIQVFGDRKVSRPGTVAVLSSVMTNFDLIAVQELRDRDGSAARVLLAGMNRLAGGSYRLIAGPRLGRSASKEQYLFYYRHTRIAFSGRLFTWPDLQDRFEREPLIAGFRVKEGKFDFFLVNIHTKPGAAASEIALLSRVVQDTVRSTGEKDVILLGDFNADGRYYDERMLGRDFPDRLFIRVTGNALDTTVAPSSNTYDRIVLTRAVGEDYTGVHGVFRLEPLAALHGVPVRRVSDHYPVWAEFYTDRDTD